MQQPSDLQLVTKRTQDGKFIAVRGHTHGDASHVHATHESVSVETLTPGHVKRSESAEYARVHKTLVYDLDSPCWVCGVRQSTLHDATKNLYGATTMQTHHRIIEWSLANACDWRKVQVDYPQVDSQEALHTFVDSEANMMVLCSVHHVHPELGAHHLTMSDFTVQRYLYDGYQIAATEENLAAVLAKDEAIEEAIQASHTETA